MTQLPAIAQRLARCYMINHMIFIRRSCMFSLKLWIWFWFGSLALSVRLQGWLTNLPRLWTPQLIDQWTSLEITWEMRRSWTCFWGSVACHEDDLWYRATNRVETNKKTCALQRRLQHLKYPKSIMKGSAQPQQNLCASLHWTADHCCLHSHILSHLLPRQGKMLCKSITWIERFQWLVPWLSNLQGGQWFVFVRFFFETFGLFSLTQRLRTGQLSACGSKYRPQGENCEADDVQSHEGHGRATVE